MSNKRNIMVCGLIAILAVIAVASVVYMNNRFDINDDISDVKAYAETLYQAGDVEGAIYQMEVYCKYVSTDIDATTKLGDWYYETGKADEAYLNYYNAAKNKALSEERITALTAKNLEEILLEPIDDVVIEITPDVRMTKDMTLVITGHNLVPEKTVEGKVEDGAEKLNDTERYYTTDWFRVDEDGKYLTMSGGFNCAIWQFKNENGNITHTAESLNTYRAKDTYSVNVYQMARAAIPEESKWCRVTYFDKDKKAATASMEEPLTITYGRLPGESRNANYSYYEIPDLKEGEKIIYENGVWSLVKGDEITYMHDWETPDIERGSYIAIGGVLPGKVSFEGSTYNTLSKEGIYTIRFDSENPSAMGERMDDAKNLGFNSAVATSTIALGENHFDSIYPWSDMKLCNMKDGAVVAYEGEEGFYSDGSNGDIFVEIPKFYVRRVVDTKHDTISVSGVWHEGFELDEAFVTKDGEADKIYVAAYLTSIDENEEAVSKPSLNPVLTLSPNELKNKAEAKGEGYRELDYAALSAIQKLFMVETGLRNSQYLYMGSCAYTIASANEAGSDYAVALTDNEKTNSLVVADTYNFTEGNSIIIFDVTDYENTVTESIKDARRVKTVINNNNGTQSVYFDGEPITVRSNVTAVAHIALTNGTTRGVGGHTGAMSTARGTVAFKYRNIENLWGNAYVYIDGVTVRNRKVTLTRRNGEVKELAYLLPEITSSNPVDNMVRRIGCDPDMPQVLLPCETGDDATISTYYGDMYSSGSYNKDYVLHFGGGWNSRACAGLFAYSVNSDADESHTNATGRMMYVK